MAKSEKEIWNADNIRSLKDRVALITGATSGIGMETARVFAEKKAHVVIGARNQKKAEDTIEHLLSENPEGKFSFIHLDLASLSSIKKCTKKFRSTFDRLDLMINNAGVMMPPLSRTLEGFELQIGTNHLGHFALNAGLFPLIESTKGSRIVTVSSFAHYTARLDLNDLNWENRKYKKLRSYSDSKIANLYYTFELARRLKEQKIKVLSVAAHPGWTNTNLQKYTTFFRIFNPYLAQKVPMGALPTLMAATGSDVNNGDFYGPSGFSEIWGYPKKVSASKRAMDSRTAETLWEISEKLTGQKFL